MLADVRKDVAQLRKQIAATSEQQAEIRGGASAGPENAQVLELSVFLNTLLSRKGISWTRILADLEKTMPTNVKVLNIQPYVTGRNQMTLSLTVRSESPGTGDPILQGAGEFGLIRWRHPERIPAAPSQADALYRYRFTVSLLRNFNLSGLKWRGSARVAIRARFWAFCCWPTWRQP